MICTVAIAFWVAPVVHAQRPAANTSPELPTPGSGPPRELAVFTADPLEPNTSSPLVRMVDAESCNTWTESSMRSPTVSATRLAVPGKASGEYQRACAAFKDKKFTEAEQHLRKAIGIYPEYAAAWVVLGQVLQAQQKRDEAQSACAQARTVDPDYVASYLCLAEFAVTEGDWNQVAEFSNTALALDPVGNAYSLYYAADAGLHLRHFSQAEMSAQSAVKLDTCHQLPELHLLLAQIFDAEGNPKDEAAQLREFLRFAPNSKDAGVAKTQLAEIDTRAASTDPTAVPW